MKKKLCAVLAALMLAGTAGLAEEFFAEEEAAKGSAGGDFFSEDFFAEESSEEASGDTAEAPEEIQEPEEEPAAEELFAAEAAERVVSESGLTMLQTGKRTVRLSWDTVLGARSYAVYDAGKKLKVTKGTSVTVSKQKEGDHSYIVKPCIDKKGKIPFYGVELTGTLNVIGWEWSGKKSVSLKLTMKDNSVAEGDLSWKYTGNPDEIDGFQLTITNAYGTSSIDLPADSECYNGVSLQYGTNTFVLQPYKGEVLGDAAKVTKKIKIAWMKPVVPQVTFVEGKDGLTLQAKWNAAKGAEKYLFTVGSEDNTFIDTVEGTTDAMPAKYNTVYTVTVTAEKDERFGTASKEVKACYVTKTDACVVSDWDAPAVTVSWAENEAASGYLVYRDGKKIADVESGTTTYTDEKASAGVLHTYQVVVYITSGGQTFCSEKGEASTGLCGIEAGKTVRFGRYPQTEKGGVKPVDWLVLEVKDGKALVISVYGLDAKPYNKDKTDTDWEHCTLRAWLNDTFLKKAFDSSEQARVLVTEVKNGEDQCYPVWKIDGGEDTTDQLFLLSYAELAKYFAKVTPTSSKIEARVRPTAYAIEKGADTDSGSLTESGKAAGWWWLRSAGPKTGSVSNVTTLGTIYGPAACNTNGCVRPAFWLNLSSGAKE